MVRHVKAAFPDLDSLFAAGEAVGSMAEQFGWTLLTDVLDREIAAETAFLEDRSEPLSRAQYAMAHGRIAGLRGAQEAADAIVIHAERIHQEQMAKHEGGAESLPEG